jgi:hypothetical protein
VGIGAEVEDHHHGHRVDESSAFEQAMENVGQIDRSIEAEAIATVVETTGEGEAAGYPIETQEEEHQQVLPVETGEQPVVEPQVLTAEQIDVAPMDQTELGTNHAATKAEPIAALPDALQGKTVEEIDDIKRRIVDRRRSK